MEAPLAQLQAFAQGIAYAAVVFLWLWIARFVAGLRTRRVFDARREIEDNQNLAIALRRGGLYVGLATGMLGALAGGETAFLSDLQTLLLEGAVITLFLFLAQLVADAALVHGVSNDEAVREGNVAVGLVEAGSFVATGLIAYGAFSGEGGGLASALVFFVLGQVALLALAVVYEWLTSYGVVENIRSGNTAAGLMLGGTLVAFGFILNASLRGAFLSWQEDLIAFGISALTGLVLLMLLQWPIDRLFLPGTTIKHEIETDRNAAAIGVAVSVKLALALVISAVVI
ncbi:MAG: DUF350 domain-containing protein [Myxococcota bacterium]